MWKPALDRQGCEGFSLVGFFLGRYCNFLCWEGLKLLKRRN